MAQAFAELKREQVDAYIQPIFDDFGFEYAARWAERGGPTGRIAKPEDLYLCDDEAGMKRFYECCDEAHRAHGFDGPKGHCPALTAEHLLVIAQNALIDASSPLFGVDFSATFGDDRRKLLDLLLGACLKKEAA